MLKLIRLCAWIFTVSAFLVLRASEPGAATPEDTLAKINRLPAAERQAALVREAKNEKTVVWYAAMNREDLRQFARGFEAEYPFLKVEVLTSGPQSLLNRILTEHRAGKYNYDTLNIRSSALYTLKKANVIMRYDTPYGEVCAQDSTTRRDTLTGSGLPSLSIFSIPSRSLARRRRNP